MKYADLIQPGPPLETVKQIRESGSIEAAGADVDTFVVSDRMGRLMREVILPNLQFDRPADQKGLLVVGTYGTGKTHLMSVLAGIAEHSELAARLTNSEAAEAAAAIAGKFRVVRFEIGATSLPLRDIVSIELQRGLTEMGVDFRFPDWETVTNTKDAFVDMMAAFEQAQPAQGLLFALDEMLEYLRARRDTELIQDLVFLREIGEVCRSTRFRFISGVQEAIFDNPRFAGVADTVRRVRDRYDQVRISREDVAFVVENRLLRKDATQRAAITAHLQKFTMLYDGMAERLDRFVGLFPVHPDYLRTFEQMTIVEKREVLRTVEREVAALLDQEVPEDSPGLICSDTYRARLVDDPSARTIPEVQVVLDRSEVLRDKVSAALPDGHYLPAALRIIDGLTVHRLTTDDIRRPIGMTPEMLRDELCLLPPGLPENDAVFLKTTVSTIIKKMLTAVSGQFISIDPENGQVFLDVDKDIDYDQQITQRAETLDPHQQDAAYYLAMEEVLARRDEPYVAGYRIWEYYLPWALTNSDRTGYLFMGAPNERSTAQPPRDFYIYFLQPYDPPDFTPEELPDEVFIELKDPPAEFTDALLRYAGATAKAKESTVGHRSIYEDKAKHALQQMAAWLRSNMATAMTVTYRGEAKTLGAWLAVVPGERASVSDQIDAVAAAVLADHFEARFPGYPKFSRRITPSTLEADVRVALTQIATRRPTGAGTAILEGLELIRDSGGELTADGTYATELTSRLSQADGKVLNRSDLLEPLDRDVLAWGPWHLEPVWLVVVAAALCHLGKVEISIDSQRIDAVGLDRLARLTPDQLTQFDHLAPPKSLPILQLRKVAVLLGLPPATVPDTGLRESGVTEMLTRAADLLRRADSATDAVIDGTELWGQDLFDLAEERSGRLDSLRHFLADVKARDSVGKMNGLDLDGETLDAARGGKEELERIEEVLAAREKLASVADFLREACGVFGAGVGESKDALTLRTDMLELLEGVGPIDRAQVVVLRDAGEALRHRFADLASRSYRHDHLDTAGDARKRELLEGPVAVLESLSEVSILATPPLERLCSELVEIRTMVDIDERALMRGVVLDGHNPPRPIDGPPAATRLERCRRQADELLAGWTQTLADSLSEGELADQIQFVTDETVRSQINHLAAKRSLPEAISPEFVAALNQVFERVDIHRLSSGDIVKALFPDTSPATAAQLRNRLEDLLDVGAKDTDRVRFVPWEEET
jgi:energy-coupling factor transporter ATP-binding protein EcfA2